MTTQISLAVLIDADNAAAKLASTVLAEVATYGTPTVKRAYGNWTTSQLSGWKSELLRNAIQPMQQFAYATGKNATDSALIIDAMDLLYAGNVDGFVIVSSDSDFTRLATRLRESGRTVIGMGRGNTPEAFVAACDRFVYLDLLEEESAPTQEANDEPVREPPALHPALSAAISNTAKDDGWSHLGEVGSYLSKRNAAFDPRDYGHTKLGALVKAQSYVEVQKASGPAGSGPIWIRVKKPSAPKARAAAAR